MHDSDEAHGAEELNRILVVEVQVLGEEPGAGCEEREDCQVPYWKVISLQTLTSFGMLEFWTAMVQLQLNLSLYLNRCLKKLKETQLLKLPRQLPADGFEKPAKT